MEKTIKKPNAVDDFFAYANYDSLKNVKVPEGSECDGGPVYESNRMVESRLATIMQGTQYVKIISLLKDGAKLQAKADIEESFNYSDEKIAEVFFGKEMFHSNLCQFHLGGKGENPL